MAKLYSQYTSGTQFTAGTITGSSLGVSGINPIVDRLNSIAASDNHITGSLVSGTSMQVWASGGQVGNATAVSGTTATFIGSSVDTTRFIFDGLNMELKSNTFSVGSNTNTPVLVAHGQGGVPTQVFVSIFATPAVGGGGPAVHYQIDSVGDTYIEVRVYNPTAFAATGSIYLMTFR